MAIEIKHSHQVDLVANPPDGVSVVQFDDWNAALVATMASGFLLGRTTGGNGAIEELTAAQVKAMLAYGSAANVNTGTAAGNVPVLGAGGLLDASLLPAIAITDVFEVSSQSAMLALTAQRGDIAIRTDLNKTFALATDAPATLANWKELRTPTDAVLAVAGLTGTITASALKTALAIATSDVSGFSADGRSLVNAANYAAMFDLLKQLATAAASGVVQLADAAALRARTAGRVATADGVSGAKSAVALTYAATRSLVWTDGWFRTCTLTGNMIVSNPTSVDVGDTIMMRLSGNDATERAVSWGANFKGNLPEQTVTSFRALLVTLTATTATEIIVSYVVVE